MSYSTVFIFGGSGYIGSFFVKKALSEHIFERIVVLDIQKPVYLTDEERGNPALAYQFVDVREPIQITVDFDIDTSRSWILNLAAIHREPGHAYREYFDTNLPGATHINSFARQLGINHLLFTSSIAPYGRSLEQRDENSPLYPETAYGISKALAEQMHRTWQAEAPQRRLIIVRPSVIFGPGDPGNVYRMIRSLKKGTFVLPDGGNIIKGYGYVYGLIESMLFTMQKSDPVITYNYAENPVVPLKDMVAIAKEELHIKKYTVQLPTNVLVILAFFIQTAFKLIGKKSDIHPVRVKKAGFPTNIYPGYLAKNGFEFKYDFRNALRHWRSVSPNDFA